MSADDVDTLIELMLTFSDTMEEVPREYRRECLALMTAIADAYRNGSKKGVLVLIKDGESAVMQSLGVNIDFNGANEMVMSTAAAFFGTNKDLQEAREGAH